MLQVAERRHGTINYTAQVWELRDEGTTRNEEMSQKPHEHAEGCVTWYKATKVSQKVTIKFTVHDLTMEKRPNGARGNI